MHLIVDGYGSDPQLLQDEGFIYGLLDRFPDQIGMKKVTPPFVFRYVGTKPEDWGLSAFVLIAESHITVHTFVEKRLVNMDIFSCKEFDAVDVVRKLKNEFKLTRVRSYTLRRGLEYPDFGQPLEMEPASPRGRTHGAP
jgi:S-adenosylmethionine decarboxylase